jgi:uncharacterized protein
MTFNARKILSLLFAPVLFGLLLYATAPGLPPQQEAMAAAQPPPGPLSEVVVETRTGAHRFMVEIADEPEERARGLMFRETLADDAGMLFDMGVTAPAGFWMRNTLVSLDIIFIGDDGRVVSIAERTVPLSEEVLRSAGPVRFVLELVAGMSDRIGLEPGDRIRHPVIEAVAGG